MNKKFLKEVKSKLLSEKDEVLNRLSQTTEVDTSGDEVDAIQGNILIDLQIRLAGKNSQKLNSIEEALKRIEDRTYGVCIDCEEDIPEKRLLTNPYFLICVDCAEDREAEEKQRKKQAN